MRSSPEPHALNFGKMVVVQNLGVDVLIGEPVKVENKILTLPHKWMVEIYTTEGKKIVLPYSTKLRNNQITIHPCKSDKKITIYPNQSISVDLPVNIRHLKYVSCSPQNKKKYTWVAKRTILVDENGSVNIHNGSNTPVNLAKFEHFANLVPCEAVCLDELRESHVSKIYDINRSDLSHLIPEPDRNVHNSDQLDYLNEIVLDPDNILPIEWKDRLFA